MFHINQLVRTRDHTRYQNLKDGGVIVPPIAHTVRGGRWTIIRAIYRERYEDEHGNDIFEDSYDTALGTFDAEELEAWN